MGDDHASAQDLLDDLTRLSQAGRLRYMNAMSQDNVIKVLGLSLQASDATSPPQKRIKTENVDFDDDSDDIAAPAQPTRKDIQLPNEPPPPPEAQPVIPRVLLLPRTDTFVDITRLPEDIRKDLQDRFRTMCNASEKRKKRYHGMQTKPQNRLNKEECIRCQFMETSKGGRRSDGYYTNGGEVNKSADDMCIERRSPCVYMVRHNGACTLCIVPLPAGLRVGKRWDELGYWVTLGDFVP